MPQPTLQHLQQPYPGRIVLIGASVGYLVMIYGIMGRSPNSRNRIFKNEGMRIYTEAADPTKVKDPSLIIYDAMLSVPKNRSRGPFTEPGVHFVSNGDQTGALMSGYLNGRGMMQSLENFQYEPDAPNFTPRISGTCWWTENNHAHVELSILRKSPFGEQCERIHYVYEKSPIGTGCCITTYTGENADPLPSFVGDPIATPLYGKAHDLIDMYWDALDPDNRISLAVKLIPQNGDEPEVMIRNKYEQVTV